MDLNSISDSESESESCGKVLLCVSEGFGFWSARLTTKPGWIITFIYLHHHNNKGVAVEQSLNHQVLHSWNT